MTERPTPNYSDAERELQRVEEKAVNDRTKAIVEAAERLAQHAQELEVIDILGRVVDRTWTLRDVSQIGSHLVELARALALPAEPAPAPSAIRSTVERLETLRQLVDLTHQNAVLSLPTDPEPPRDLIALARDLRSIWRHDADGDLCTVGPNDEIEGILRAWDRAVEKLDAPRWTKEPPSEPGWYWTLCRTDLSPRPFLARLNDAGLWHVEESEFSIPLDDVENWEWWPVRLQEPPA